MENRVGTEYRMRDEVWRQLNPSAGRLRGRTTRRLWLAFALTFALVVGIAAGWYTGLLMPQLVWPNVGGGWETNPEGVIRMQVDIENGGLVPATIVRVGRSGPGLELLDTDGPLPAALGPGDAITVILVYRVTDCGAVPRGSWPVSAVVDRFWGEQTAYVGPAHIVSPWQEEMAAVWCDHR